MFDCVNTWKRHAARDKWYFTCRAREHQGSHGGGSDFGPRCRQNVGNFPGKHKGNHISENGYTWAPGANDVWPDWDTVDRPDGYDEPIFRWGSRVQVYDADA